MKKLNKRTFAEEVSYELHQEARTKIIIESDDEGWKTAVIFNPENNELKEVHIIQEFGNKSISLCEYEINAIIEILK